MNPSPQHTVLVEDWPELWPANSHYVTGKHVILPHVASVDYPEGAKRWNMIRNELEQFSPQNTYDLKDLILFFNPNYRGKWKFDVLDHVVNRMMPADARAHLLHVTLPGMSRLSLELPRLFPRPVPLLTRGRGAQLSLSQRQVACLLAHAFFCTYPRRNRPDSSLPSINFNGLFQSHVGRPADSSRNKLLCILNYFIRVVDKPPEGVVTFSRLQMSQSPDWRVSNKPLRVTSLQERGTIEDNGHNMLQVSFANKRFGGGVLDRGCVQEEIRCVTCPEMIVARLFTEDLHHNEAFLVQGVERYSSYSGYAGTFKFKANFNDETPRDENHRRCCSLVAIDATNFARPIDKTIPDVIKPKPRLQFNLTTLILLFVQLYQWFINIILVQRPRNQTPPGVNVQFSPRLINRELNKAFVGFNNPEGSENNQPVATGNWGCGVFLGNPELKFLLQVMAASQAERDLNFFTFGDRNLQYRLFSLANLLNQGTITVGNLYTTIINYHKRGGDLFSYLRTNLKMDSPRTRIPAIAPSTHRNSNSKEVLDRNNLRLRSTQNLRTSIVEPTPDRTYLQGQFQEGGGRQPQKAPMGGVTTPHSSAPLLTPNFALQDRAPSHTKPSVGDTFDSLQSPNQSNSANVRSFNPAGLPTTVYSPPLQSQEFDHQNHSNATTVFEDNFPPDFENNDVEMLEEEENHSETNEASKEVKIDPETSVLQNTPLYVKENVDSTTKIETKLTDGRNMNETHKEVLQNTTFTARDDSTINIETEQNCFKNKKDEESYNYFSNAEEVENSPSTSKYESTEEISPPRTVDIPAKIEDILLPEIKPNSEIGAVQHSSIDNAIQKEVTIDSSNAGIENEIIRKLKIGIKELEKNINLKEEQKLIIYNNHIRQNTTRDIIIWGNSKISEEIFNLQKSALQLVNFPKTEESYFELFNKFNILTVPCMYILECVKVVREPNQNCEISTGESIKRQKLELDKDIVDKIYDKLPEKIKSIKKNKPCYIKVEKFLKDNQFPSVAAYMMTSGGATTH